MKIIKEPTYDKRIMCNLCQCEFEFEKDDLKKEVIANSTYGYEGNILVYLTVKCPFCQNEIDVTNRIIKK